MIEGRFQYNLESAFFVFLHFSIPHKYTFPIKLGVEKYTFPMKTKVKNYTFPKKGSYSSPSTLQQSNPISLALSGPKVK